MTEEPVYHFKKGQGWVISTVETRTAEFGIYRFTVEKRHPRQGEVWSSSNLDIDDFFEKYQGFCNCKSTNPPKVIGRPSNKFVDYGDEYYYTIKLELL